MQVNELYPLGSKRSRMSSAQASNLDEAEIEYFLEQFSNLHAICEAIIGNDEDED